MDRPPMALGDVGPRFSVPGSAQTTDCLFQILYPLRLYAASFCARPPRQLCKAHIPTTYQWPIVQYNLYTKSNNNGCSRQVHGGCEKARQCQISVLVRWKRELYGCDGHTSIRSWYVHVLQRLQYDHLLTVFPSQGTPNHFFLSYTENIALGATWAVTNLTTRSASRHAPQPAHRRWSQRSSTLSRVTAFSVSTPASAPPFYAKSPTPPPASASTKSSSSASQPHLPPHPCQF